MVPPKDKADRYLQRLHKLGAILFFGPAVVAMTILAILGNEEGRRILDSAPVAIPGIILYGSGILLLVYLFIKSFLRSYRNRSDNKHSVK